MLRSVSPRSGNTMAKSCGSTGFKSEESTSRSKRADRKSTRLNSSHSQISYAVFCLKKKKKIEKEIPPQTQNHLLRQDVDICDHDLTITPQLLAAQTPSFDHRTQILFTPSAECPMNSSHT